jgi:hypothetical protein
MTTARKWEPRVKSSGKLAIALLLVSPAAAFAVTPERPAHRDSPLVAQELQPSSGEIRVTGAVNGSGTLGKVLSCFFLTQRNNSSALGLSYHKPGTRSDTPQWALGIALRAGLNHPAYNGVDLKRTTKVNVLLRKFALNYGPLRGAWDAGDYHERNTSTRNLGSGILSISSQQYGKSPNSGRLTNLNDVRGTLRATLTGVPAPSENRIISTKGTVHVSASWDCPAYQGTY